PPEISPLRYEISTSPQGGGEGKFAGDGGEGKRRALVRQRQLEDRAGADDAVRERAALGRHAEEIALAVADEAADGIAAVGATRLRAEIIERGVGPAARIFEDHAAAAAAAGRPGIRSAVLGGAEEVAVRVDRHRVGQLA